MSSKCPHCGSEVDNYNAAIVADLLEDNRSWDYYESDYHFPEGKVFRVANLGDVKIVKKKTEYTGSGRWGDGELEQGTEYDVYMIFEVAGRFYRKEGHGDSYERVSWNGPFREVKPTTKTVTVYEFDN